MRDLILLVAVLRVFPDQLQGLQLPDIIPHLPVARSVEERREQAVLDILCADGQVVDPCLTQQIEEARGVKVVPARRQLRVEIPAKQFVVVAPDERTEFFRPKAQDPLIELGHVEDDLLLNQRLIRVFSEQELPVLSAEQPDTFGLHDGCACGFAAQLSAHLVLVPAVQQGRPHLLHNDAARARIRRVQMDSGIVLDQTVAVHDAPPSADNRNGRRPRDGTVFNDADHLPQDPARDHIGLIARREQVVHVELLQEIGEVFLSQGNDHTGVLPAKGADHLPDPVALLLLQEKEPLELVQDENNLRLVGQLADFHVYVLPEQRRHIAGKHTIVARKIIDAVSLAVALFEEMEDRRFPAAARTGKAEGLLDRLLREGAVSEAQESATAPLLYSPIPTAP